MVFRQIALVLGLEIHAPAHRKLEGAVGLLQNADRFSVIQPLERRLNHLFQPSDTGFVDPLGEKRHVVGALGQQGLENRLQQRFGQIGVGVQIGEGGFRLHHPEFGQMTAGVGVLGAKRRAKRVNFRQGQTVSFDVELAGNGQKGLAAEEILVEIDAALGRARRIDHVQGADPKQRAGPLAVAGGDDRGMHPEIAALVEKAVNGLGEAMAHPRHGADAVGARSQMRHRPQIFEAVRLGSDGIGFGVFDPADDLDGLGPQFHRLAFAGGSDQLAGDPDRATGGQVQHFALIIGQFGRHDHLKRIETRTVVNGHERQARLGIAAGAHPALHGRRPAQGDLAAEHGGDGMCGHRTVCSRKRPAPKAGPRPIKAVPGISGNVAPWLDRSNRPAECGPPS